MNISLKFTLLLLPILVITLIGMWAFIEIGLQSGTDHWKFYASLVGWVGSASLMALLIVRRKRIQ